MEWLDHMNRAIDYIEDHLEEKMDYEKVAQAACSSASHFQRIFTFITNLPLSEYVRRRKMTLAAFELQNSDIRVIDLALKYGYDSPESFTRAFQVLHGVTPTSARRMGTHIKAYPRITFQLTVKGVSEMNYRIVEREAFEVYGIEGIFDTKDGENLKAIPEFWAEKMNNGECERLSKSANYPSIVNAVCDYKKTGGTTFPYMLCVIQTPLSDTSGYTTVQVPASTWAVFVNEPHSMEETAAQTQALISRVYTDWLPTSKYDMVEGFEFEMYYATVDNCFYEEVWIRVSPKK